MNVYFQEIAISGLCWSSLGVSISSVAGVNWVQRPNSTLSLWYVCDGNVKNCTKINNAEPYLMASRAFTIMCCVLIFLGGLTHIYSQCKRQKIARLACSIIFFIAGLSGIIGMSIFSAYTAPSSSVSQSYNTEYINAWVGSGLSILAGGVALYTYFVYFKNCKNQKCGT